MCRSLPQARDVRGYVLSLEGEVFRDDGVGGQAAEGAGGREREAEEVAGGADARHGGDEGTAVRKMVT